MSRFMFDVAKMNKRRDPLPKPPRRPAMPWFYRLIAFVVLLMWGIAAGFVLAKATEPEPPKPKTPMARIQQDLLDLYNDGCAVHVTMRQFANLEELETGNRLAAAYMDEQGVEYRIVSARLPGVIVRYLGVVVWCEAPPE